MAFRASNVIPAKEYEKAKTIAISLKSYCQRQAQTFASGANSDEIIRTVKTLNDLKSQLQATASTPGIANYATEQENDGTYNVATEFTSLINSIDAAISEIVTALPKDTDDYLLVTKINPDGSLDFRTFASGAMNTLRTLLNNIVNAID